MSRVDEIESLEKLTREAQGKDMRDWDYIERYYMWDLKEMKNTKPHPMKGTDIYDEKLVDEIGKKVLYNGCDCTIIGLHLEYDNDCYILKRNHHIHYKSCDEELKFI